MFTAPYFLSFFFFQSLDAGKESRENGRQRKLKREARTYTDQHVNKRKLARNLLVNLSD